MLLKYMFIFAAISALKRFVPFSTSYPTSLAAMAFSCQQCLFEFSSYNALRNHLRRFTDGSCCPPMTTDEYSLLSPSDVDAWKVRCNPCSKDFSKRAITDHLINVHSASQVMVRGWHIHKDAMAAKNGKDLASWSRFQLAWDRKHNSMRAPPNLALADGPVAPFVLGADAQPGNADIDPPEREEEMEAQPAPPSVAGSSTDGVLERRRWKQDILASEDRIMARMDQMHSYMQQTVESFNSAAGRIG